MEQSGLQRGQVAQVRGFADQNLRKPAAPEDASNRRVSVIVQYQVNPDAAPPADARAAGGDQKAAPAAPAGQH
jgi:hypothetical protein